MDVRDSESAVAIRMMTLRALRTAPKRDRRGRRPPLRRRLFTALGALLALAPPLLGESSPVVPLRGNPQGVEFEHLTTEDGLSHSSVWDVLQDRRGFLWFATAGLLQRYDGYRFTSIQHDPADPESVSAEEILEILDAASGRAERLERDFDRLDAAARKLRRLLEELFELSRVGVQSNPPEEVTFGELVREALAALAGPIAERGVEVAVAEDLPVVRGDRSRLVEAVRHLVSNAVQYLGDQASPRIEVGMRGRGVRGEPPEQIFFVRDNGVGIDPQYHDKVFGLFERLDPEGSEGTGIGLALVQRIVEVHGGRIWVESEGRGQGSTFCFTLPRPTRGEGVSR